ncbi:SLC13 family permease [Pseudogemmobacter blasticus]|uniref:SLC13 family permease n=1 Tax=Fuscovulum blasticum DSM 2131 TaxID=1188250 RepID=A0A2T4JCE4_FUSBL|nr:SLC13 family permease [Fuscovulum blasticum]PTE15574.1 SLC13 family permease [Fuscovulum blasticum DSM 2131]
MTQDLALVLCLLAATVLMFALNRPRMDAVALIMMTLLPLTGVITLEDSLAGFSDPNVLLIALLFVVGEALVRTGVAQRLGDLLVRSAGPGEARLIGLLMVLVAGIGSFMSSTGVVAIFIPIVLRVAASSGTSARRLMMPLSVAALISGMMTLVATAPNLVVNAQLIRAGHDGFSFFAFTPFGLPVLVLAILVMVATRRWLGGAAPAPGPDRPHLADWIAAYGLGAREVRVRVEPGSAWAGRRLDALDLRATSGINVIAVERGRGFGHRLIRPAADTLLEPGDVLFLDMFSPGIAQQDFAARFGLHPLPISGRYFSDHSQDIGMVELLVPPGSALIGKTVTDARFRSEHGLAVIGIKHGSKPVTGPVPAEPLRLGDTLLAVGPWKAIGALRSGRDLLVLNLPAEMDEVIERPRRAPHALAVLALIVALMVTGVVPNVQAALIGCLLLGLFGCVDMNGAYRAMHWQSLIVIVGMLPFSVALQNTGGVDLAASVLVAAVGDAGPRVALAALFVLTALFGLFISNTATAVLVAPVALAVATELGASPYPFAMTVALAASAAFLMPVSSPVNMLVVGPGSYTLTDFLRIGTPLVAITLVITIALVPLVFPF